MDFREELGRISEKIWDLAEIKFNEYKSSAALSEWLEAKGFEVTRNLGGMETAFTAVYGQGGPTVGFLGEYDALSGLAQSANSVVKEKGDGCGHGCGHHMLGTAAAGAAYELQQYLKEKGCAGRVKFIGCPAEEGGSGKAYLARAGVFDDCDVLLTWHPGAVTTIVTGSMQANCQAYFRFTGISSHAAASPHLGRSALDAVELMNVGCNYMREHMEPTDRLHYAVTDTGGISPNVVQSHAEVLYLVRSTTSKKVEALYERVCNIARGAALMTGTEVEIVFDKACSNTLPNKVLETVMYEAAKEVPLPTYTKEELAYAQQYRDTVTENELTGDIGVGFIRQEDLKEVLATMKQSPIYRDIAPYYYSEKAIAGSSDVGDASHVAPTAQIWVTCYAVGTPGHSWQMVAQGKSSVAKKGMNYAMDVMARTAEKLLENPELIAKAKAEFDEKMGGEKYKCPIPDEIQPNQNKK